MVLFYIYPSLLKESWLRFSLAMRFVQINLQADNKLWMKTLFKSRS